MIDPQELQKLADACARRDVPAHTLAAVMAACLELGWVMVPPDLAGLLCYPKTNPQEAITNADPT